MGEKKIEEIGILDLRGATRKDIEDMGPMENVGVIIVPEELKGLISSKIKKNVGIVVSARKNDRIFSGDTTINREMLEALEEPVEFFQAGRLTVSDDVTKELIKEKIKSFRSYGLLVAPKELHGILMAKCIETVGGFVTPEEMDNEEF